MARRRLFTHDEASAMLPTLRPILEAMQGRKRELDAARERLAEIPDSSRTNGGAALVFELEEQIAVAVREISALLEAVQAQGIEVKDIGAGLVDFPAEREGRVVYLCWLVSEAEIAWWHELDGGFAGRRPL